MFGLYSPAAIEKHEKSTLRIANKGDLSCREARIGTVLRNKSIRCRINELPNKYVTLLRRASADVTSTILPPRNVNLTSLPIARILLILKAVLFLRTTPALQQDF